VQPGMALVVNRWIECLDVKRAVGFQLALAHLVKTVRAMLVNDREQLFAGERWLAEAACGESAP
jgi:hypothetical protein